MPFKLTLILLFFYSCQSPKNDIGNKDTSVFSIVIHGGAGTILKKNMTKEMEIKYINKLEEAIEIGYEILKNGGSSQEAVEKTINVMEDSPLFNAGKGAVLNFDGNVELDASFMNGSTLDAGAISGASKIKNPISAAIAVMNNSPHVMLSGTGADEFASSQKLELKQNSYFITERRSKSLDKVKFKENSTVIIDKEYLLTQKYGTVGCVALDQNGNISSGTSTGGMTNKKWNRIGDAPIIGAGTYANNATCAVSSTGWGEFFIRAMVAHDISAMMEYKGISLQEAATIVIQEKVPDLGGDGGIVAIDKDGNIAMEFNTAGMYRAHMNAQGALIVKIYKNE